MNQPMESTGSQIRNVRGERFLRTLHGILPLGRHYQALLGALNSDQGLLVIPFGSFSFLIPAAWRKLAANFLLIGPDVMPELPLLKPIIQNLKAGSLVDVGANMGLYTMFMRTHSALPIVAYEPQPFLCGLARRSVALNHFDAIEVRNIGCGAERGEVLFHNNPNGSVAIGSDTCSAASSEPSDSLDWETQAHRLYRRDTITKIPITTLDEDLANRLSIALVKIDCEGFEFQVLQGARRVIERHRPWLFIEIHPTPLKRFASSPQAIVDMLRPFYEMEFWCFDKPHRNSLAKSLAKFRTRKGIRYADEKEMLAAADGDLPPGQIYCIGRPKSA